MQLKLILTWREEKPGEDSSLKTYHDESPVVECWLGSWEALGWTPNNGRRQKE